MSMNGKIDDLDKRLAVVSNQMEHQNKMLERIEQKLEKK